MLEDSRVRVSHAEISAKDRRSVTMGGGDQESGPKEGLTHALDIFVLLSLSRQGKIVNEDGCAFDVQSECVPTASHHE